MSDEIKDMNAISDETADKIAVRQVAESNENLLPDTSNYEVDDSIYDDEEDLSGGKSKKKKKYKKPLNPAQRKKRTIRDLIITGSVFLVLAIFFSSVAIANTVGVKALLKNASSFAQVEYTQHEQLKPILDETDGYWTFTAEDERDFKVMQFTDVHIGGGTFSNTKDLWAMNAVATMIKLEQPDLVIITGDIAYPVPFQAGTFNNLAATQIFATMMENLGVYWTFAFGNHDTEMYSMYERKDICDYYENAGFKYCLFNRGFASEERGYGNNIIKVKNNDGVITQALVTLDSHSYIDGDYFGAAWKYDNIHQSQVDWYVGEMQELVKANDKLADEKPELGIVKGAPVKNMAFFHIPLVEYREAWAEIFEANGGSKEITVKETEHVKHHYGIMGESDGQKNGKRTYGVFCGMHEDEFFEQGVLNGLQGTFCGHDHYNNFSIDYTKEVDGKEYTVRLTYGMSIDYLAYPGIYKEHSQRGCTVIEVNADGDFSTTPKNYYEYEGVVHEKD
ncbi:MAG: metallophosphoesterase [Clostridia bacterium]|nr:metallophosphoesterase [Clostridia bacterium]